MLKAYKFRIYPTKTQITLLEKHFGSTRFLYNYFLDYCKAKNIDRDINASINIRNYGIGQLDNRNRAGTVQIQACGVSSDGVVVYNTATSHDMLKQEAQSSLA